MKQLNKYITFLGLYIAQSIPMSFFTTVVPVIMRQENYSLEYIGLLQFVKLPWILKFLWAPLIDKKANTLGQFKKLIVSSEVFYAAIILLIGFFDLQTDFPLIVLFVVLAIVASATQDITTDALAVLTLKEEQRSMGNAVQSVGGFLGALIGSGVLLLIYNAFGWRALLVGLAGFVLLALIPLKFFNYRLKEKPRIEKISIRSVGGFFTRKGVGKYVLFLLLSYSGLSGIMAMLKPYMVDHGYDLAQIGYLSGILGTASAAVAALLSGIIIKRIGLKHAMLAYCLLALGVGVFFWHMNSLPFTRTHLTVAICSMWAVYGMMNVAVYVLAMNHTRSGLEGTDFTVQLVVAQFGSLLVAGLSGFVAKTVGYQGLFVLEILLALITFVYIVLLYKAGHGNMNKSDTDGEALSPHGKK